MRVSDVLELLANGAPTEEVLSDHPSLVRDDVLAAIAYAAVHMSHAVIRVACGSSSTTTSSRRAGHHTARHAGLVPTSRLHAPKRTRAWGRVCVGLRARGDTSLPIGSDADSIGLLMYY